MKLYATIANRERFLVHPLTSKHHSLVFYYKGLISSHMTVILALDSWAEYAVVQSEPHWKWSLEYGNKLETRPQYTPSDCLETFPFPSFLNPEYRSPLQEIGERYYQHRQSIMQARQEGLTKTYNRFHDPKETAADIAELRRLHVAMDEAVAAAYGWHDLIGGQESGFGSRESEESTFPEPRHPRHDTRLSHGFHATKQGTRYTLSETARREVLDRLLELNHQRYAEEVADGLHDKKASKPTAAKRVAKPAPTGAKPQTDLFGHAQLDVFEAREEKLPSLPGSCPSLSDTATPASRSPLLDYLQTHPGWHGKDALLTATRFPDNRWNAEIKRLIDSGQVEREGERRGARYRFRGA